MRNVLLILLLVSAVAHAQQQLYKTAVVCFYNLENFYDTINNPQVNDDDFTPLGARHYTGKIYLDKITHLATVLSQIGTDITKDGPALIGVAEIENDTVLNDLVHHPLLAKRHYNIVHYDSKDARGVDVALLYNPAYFKVLSSEKLFVQLPGGAKDSYFTRDVLWVKGLLDGEVVHVFVNHWPSRLGGEERSTPARVAAALVDRNIIDSIQQTEPNAKIIVTGDLNDDPVSPSVVKALNTSGDMHNLKLGCLYNPWVDFFKKGNGTLAYADAWGLFDQIIISASWLDRNTNGFFYYQPHIFNKEFMIENTGRYKGYPMRTWDGDNYRGGYSDHFPTYIVLLKKVKAKE